MGMVKLAMVAIVAISSIWGMSMAQSGISNSCTNVLISLSPCLNYITGNSSTPSSSCCSQLASIVKSDPQCLCQVINGGASNLASGLNINQTQALGLPTACNVQTPSLSRCNGASSPSGSPKGSATTPSITNGGSKTTPTTQGDSSNANKSMSTTIPLFLALFFFVSNALAFNAV